MLFSRRMAVAALLVLACSTPAQAAEGDIFTKETPWCASTHPGHGTLPGFGPALDLNGNGREDYRWPVYAPGDGRIRVYSSDGPWGNSVIWSSADARERIHLAHLDSFGKTGRVRAGDLIGRVGNTGVSDGSHVHASARRGGRPADVELGGRDIRAGRCYVSRGPEVPTCHGRSATVVGTSGPDVLAGSRRVDVIVGGGGRDRIAAHDGRDLVCGGPGDDILRGGHGADLLFGGVGRDAAVGGGGSDHLAGDAGVDRLAGGPRGDHLRGGVGNDRVAGGFHDDRISGGAGRDIASFVGATVRVRVDLRTRSSRGQGRDALVAIENVVGSTFGDELIGSSRANDLLGGIGNDLLDGAGGRDGARGGPGTDTCVAEDTEGCEPADPEPSPSPSPSASPSP